MESKEKNFVSAVVYIHNNENETENFLKKLISCFQKRFDKSEIICVDDFSTDGSAEKIKEIAGDTDGSCPNITILSMSYYHGNEVAMNIGIDLSIGDFVFEFDSIQWELSEDIIYNAYQKVLTGYDIVSIGVSENTDWFSDGFYYLLNKHTTLPYKIGTEVFRVLSRRALNRIHDLNYSISYRKVNYAECGLSIIKDVEEIQRCRNCRKQDRQEKRYRWKLAIDALFKNTDIGLRYSIFLSVINLVLLVISLIFKMLYLLGLRLVNTDLTVIILLFIGFLITNLFTIVIRYQTIMVRNIYKRKHYSYKNIEKLTK